MPIPRDLEEPPAEPELDPPVSAAAHELPFHAIPWEDFEKLCLRIVKHDGEPEHAQRFGTAGQDQSGIDIYARHVDGVYVVYQCRRVSSLTDADIRRAVDDFLAGEWAGQATRFVFCTSQSSVPTRLAGEVETQAARLRTHDPPISFVLWDAEVLADELRRYPDIVEQFFGRAWLERFLPGEVVAATDARLAEIQEAVARIEQRTTQQIVPFIFDWDPRQARQELAELLREDDELFLKLEERIGNPPDAIRVVNLISEEPDWLTGPAARPWRILALIAEKAGEWAAATHAWEAAAARTQPDYERAGLLVAAAVAASVGDDKPTSELLLSVAKELAPNHPRVAVQEVDQSLGGEARLAALESVASDEPLVGALIASHRALAYLLLADMDGARRALAEAQELNPRSASTRMLAVNVAVQQARLDSLAHRRFDHGALTAAQEDALRLLDQLHRERRYAEAMRVRMLAADALTLVGERKSALALLTGAPPEERAVPDAGDVLGDAALRALGWQEALELTEGAAPSDTVRRIRASALVEVGTYRERAEALSVLDELVAAGGDEAPQAALLRIAAALDARAADWNPAAAELLRSHGYGSAAISGEAFYLDRRKGDTAAVRGDESRMKDAAEALLASQPAQDVLVDCGRALGLAGDRDRARRVLESVATDATCPAATRADAYALLIPLLDDLREWEQAYRFHQQWVELRPGDARHNVWAPRIANRLRTTN
jgi:tetratricopeptide (TPR) repeat protein